MIAIELNSFQYKELTGHSDLARVFALTNSVIYNFSGSLPIYSNRNNGVGISRLLLKYRPQLLFDYKATENVIEALGSKHLFRCRTKN